MLFTKWTVLKTIVHTDDLDCCSEMSNIYRYHSRCMIHFTCACVCLNERWAKMNHNGVGPVCEPPDLSSKRESFVHWWLSDWPGNLSSFPFPPLLSLSVTGTDKTLDVPSNISGNESLKHDPAAPTSPAPRQKRLTNLADTVHLTDDGGKSEMKEREEKEKDAGEVTQGEGDKVKKKKSEAFRYFHVRKLKYLSSHVSQNQVRSLSLFCSCSCSVSHCLEYLVVSVTAHCRASHASLKHIVKVEWQSINSKVRQTGNTFDVFCVSFAGASLDNSV